MDNAFTSDKTLKEGYVRDKPCHNCLYSGLKLEKLSPGASYQDFAVRDSLKLTYPRFWCILQGTTPWR